MSSISSEKQAIYHNREKLYRSLFENHPDLVLLTDQQGVIIESNGNKLEEAISGSGHITGKNILDHLSEDNRRKISGKLPDLLVGHNVQLEGYFEKATSPFHGLISFVPFEEGGTITGFFIQVRDITEKIQHEQEETLLNQITLALSSNTSLSFGMQEVLALLCQATGFQYGEFWMPMFGINYLVMKSLWYEDPSLSSFAAVSKTRKFKLPHELPPLFNSLETCFCGDLQDCTKLNRKKIALAHGIFSYITIPIIYRDTFIGAAVLFSKSKLKKPLFQHKKLQTILTRLGAEIEKRQSNEELDKFFNLTPDLLGIIGLDRFLKKINPAFEQLLGFSKKELFSLPYLDFVHPEDKILAEEAFSDAAKGNSTEGFGNGIRCRKKDGSYVWISWTNKPAVDEGLIYLVGRDITESKKQLEEIKRIKVAVESSSDAICIGKSLKELVYTNKAFERILGWNAQLINDNGGILSILKEPEENPAIYQFLMENGHWEGDVELCNIHGNVIPFNLRSNVVLDEEGAFKYVVGIFTDISENQKALREIKKLSKAVEENSNEIYIIDLNAGKFSYVNKRAQENLGYSAAELKEIDLHLIVPEFPIEKSIELTKPLLEGKVKNVSIITFHARKDGSRYPVETHLSLFDYGDSPSLMVQVMDITERIKAEDALRLSNERYQLATKATHDAIWDWDLSSNLIYLGDGYNALFGHNFPSTIGVDQWIRYIHPDDAKMVVEALFERIASDKKQWSVEYRYKCANGLYKFIKERAYLIHDENGKTIRMTGAMSDISEQKRNETLLKEFNAELETKVYEKTTRLREVLEKVRREMDGRVEAEKVLQDSLLEKEILLKEIHHRVKNNMAIISGLLSLQARQTQLPEVKTLFKESQSRIKSMALVHEHLYQNRNLSKINFREYMRELMEGISYSFPYKEEGISLQLEADDYEMDIVQAVPCGLILNELVTNCYKYAFPGMQKGVIKVGFRKKEKKFVLKVSDDGVGLPADFNMADFKSLGLKLVCNLSRQIGGTLKVRNQEGATFIVKFQEERGND